MLEGVVASLLNQYLGQFLEGLDAEQFKISVWGGQVNLKDVKVRPGALDMLHLPLRVKYGTVSRLHLSADWRHLGSKPVIVELEGVYVVAVPSSKSTIDERAEMQSALEAKLAKLQGMEDLRFSPEAEDDGAAANSYVGRMATKIIDNVQVVLRDIHIRYEDFEGPHAPTSFGVGLQELRAQTTDDKWQPTFSTEPNIKTFKMISMTNLLVYMNVDDQTGASASAIAAQVPAAHGSKAAASANPEGAGPHKALSVTHLLNDPSTSFLLRPVSGFLRMWMHRDAHTAPRIWVDSSLYDISLQLSELQYGELLGLVNRVSASHSSMAALMRSFTEHFRAGTIAERREYVRLYKATLNAMWLPPLDDAQKRRKEQLEHDLRYEDIRQYRLAAIGELKRELGIIGGSREVGVSAAGSAPEKRMKSADKARSSVMLREQAAKLTSTFFGLGKSKSIVAERELTESEREAIYANVESEVVEVLEEVPPEFVQLALKFSLETLSFALADRQNHTLAVLAAQQTVVNLTVREGSISSILTLGNIVMTDRCTHRTLWAEIIRDADRAAKAAPMLPPAAGAPPTLARQTSAPIAPGAHVLQVEVHTPPLDGSCDLRVAVRMKAPQICIHQPFIARMIQFFSPPAHIDWRALNLFDSSAAQELAGFRTLSIVESIKLHQSVEISLDIKAPTIVVPRNPTSASSDVLVLDLGAVKVASRVSKRAEMEALGAALEKLSAEALQQLPPSERVKLYDTRTVGVKRVQCYLTIASEFLSSSSSSFSSGQGRPVYLLEPFDFGAQVQTAMTPDIIDMPDVRVIGELPPVQFHLSNTKYKRLLKLATTFESIVAALTPPPVDEASQEPLLTPARLQNAQALLKQTIGTSAPAPASASDEHAVLDLAALTKIMPTLLDAQRLMAEVDVDGDGSITRAEFRTWAAARTKRREFNQTLEVQFKAAAIQLSFSTDSITVPGRADLLPTTSVLSIRIEHIGLSMRQFSHQLKLGLSIGALRVHDLLSKYADSKYLLYTRSAHDASDSPEAASRSEGDAASSVAATPRSRPPAGFFAAAPADERDAASGSEFIRIELVTTAETSASFASRPVDVDVRVAFSPVRVCLEPSSLYRVGTFLFRLFVIPEDGALVTATPQRPRTSVTTPLIASPPAVPAQTKAVSAPASRVPRASRVAVHVALHFESLKVQLFSRDDSVAEAVIDSLHSELRLFSSTSMQVSLQLDKIWVKDCTDAGAVYPFIVCTRAMAQSSGSASSAQPPPPDASLVKIQFDTFSANEADYPGHQTALHASLQGLQFVFLQRFVNELTLFFTMGSIADLLAFISAHSAAAPEEMRSTDLTTAAAAASQHYATAAVQSFVKLDLRLSGVDLLVPHHSTSDEVLLARIEQIGVSNALLTAKEDQQQYMQMCVKSSAFMVTSLIRAHANKHMPLLQLSPFTVNVHLLSHLSRIVVDIDTEALTSVLAPAQFCWLLALPSLNLAEGATVVQAIPLRRTAATRGRGVSSPSPSMGPNKMLLSPPALELQSPAPVAAAAIEPAKPQLAPDAIVFKLNATMHHLSFTLTENRYEPAASKGGVCKGGLVVFEMTELLSGVELRANGGLDASSLMESMSMRDVSEGGSHIRGKPILPAYRQLMLIVQDVNDITQNDAAATALAKKKKAAGVKPPLYFTLNKRVDAAGIGWTTVELSVANFRFNVGPVLLKLPTFFAPPKTAEASTAAASLQDLSRPAQAPVVQSSSSKPVALSQAPSYLVFKLTVAEPVIQLLQDPTSEQSEALLLTFGLSSEVLLSENAQRSVLSADFHLTALKCYSTLLDVNRIGFVQLSDDSSVSGVVLAPFSVNGHVKLSTPTDALDAVSILEPLDDPTQQLSLPTLKASFEVDPISLRLSYLTWRLLLRTLDAQTHATSEADAQAEEAGLAIQADIARADAARSAAAPAGGLPRIPLAEQRGARGTADGEHSEVDAAQPLDVSRTRDDTEPVVQHTANAIFFCEDVRVQVRTVQLALVNDSHMFDIPIARFQLDDLSVRVHGFAHHRSILAELHLHADYYNQAIVTWEPMLEPYTMLVNGAQTYILSSVQHNQALEQAVDEPADEAHALQSVDKVHAGGDFAYSGALLSTRLTITSPSALALNVTHAMYRGMLETINLFDTQEADRSQHESSSPRSKRKGFGLLRDASTSARAAAPGGPALQRADSSSSMAQLIESQTFHRFRFENATEFPVTITTVAHAAANATDHASAAAAVAAAAVAAATPTKSGDDLQLPPYSVLSFDFPPAISVKDYALRVLVQREDFPSLSFTAAMRMMDSQTFQLPVGADGKTARLVWEIRVQDGIKVARLRGIIGLRNSTAFELELKATGATTSERAPPQFPILPPGATHWLPVAPLHASGGFLLCMRPRNSWGSSALATSDFAWSSPFILLPDFSRQHQYTGCVHQAGVPGSASTVSVTGDRSPAATSSVVGTNGDFAASVSIAHSWLHGDDTLAQQETPGDDSGVKGGRTFTAQIYDVGPLLLLQNLLAADIDFRVVERGAKEGQDSVHWSSAIKRGATQPVHLLINAKQTYIQTRIPSLQTGWSDLLPLPVVPPEGHTTVQRTLSVSDASHRELSVQLEIHLKGVTRIVLFVPFWIQDLTGCGLILSSDTKQTVPLGPFEQFRASTRTNVRTPVMFNFPDGFPAGKAKEVRLSTLENVEKAGGWSDVRWSAPINIDALGLESTTTICGPPQMLPGESEAWLRSLSDIGVEVTQASGKYRRTKIVRFQPHYIFINQLPCDLELTQRISTNPQLIHKRKGNVPPAVLKAGATQEWHWPDHAANRTVIVRRAGEEFADWRWSGELDPSSLGELTIMLRHKSNMQRCFFLRCEVHVQHATVFVKFTEYSAKSLHQLLPYSIQNRCAHQPMRVRQFIPPKGHKDCTIPVGACDWLTVGSYSVLHLAPEVPIYARPLLLEVQLGLSVRDGSVHAERSLLINLDEVKNHGKIALAPIAGDELSSAQTVYLYTESDGATNVVRVSNFPSAEDFEAHTRRTESKLTTKQMIVRQRERRWAELLDMRNTLNRQIQHIQQRIGQASAHAAAAADPNAKPRPSGLSPRDSGLLVEVKSARGVRFSDSYVRVALNGSSPKSGPVVSTKGKSTEPTYNQHYLLPTTSTPASAMLQLQLMESNSWPMKDFCAGTAQLSLFDCGHEPKTLWLPVKNGGNTVAELQVALWHVPRADQQQSGGSNFLASALDEKSRIARAVSAEMKSMQRRQMIDEQGHVLPVHLQNDCQFVINLLAIEGFLPALRSMNNSGDIVCHMRSQLTGKTASVLCMHFDPAQQAASVPTPAASASSGSADQAAVPVQWQQPVSLHVPDELLSSEQEVLHLAFFFEPLDTRDDAAAAGAASPPGDDGQNGMLQNASFLRATRLRSHLPPILLAHTACPLNAVPVLGSSADVESQTPKKQQQQGQQRSINWLQNRLPLQSDMFGPNESSVFVTLSVVRLESRSEEARSQMCVQLVLPEVSLSLIDDAPSEILLFSVRGIAANVDDTLCTQDVEVKIDSLQLDDQRIDAVFPIVLGFAPVEVSEKQAMVQLSVAKRKSRLPVALFEYVSLLVQQLDVKVDEKLIYAIVRFADAFRTGDEAVDSMKDDGQELQVRLSEYFAPQQSGETLLWFNFLQVQPIAVNLSFEAAPGMRARMSGSRWNPVDMVLSFAGTALASIHAAPIRLNGRTFEHVRGSSAVILGSLAHHYKSESIAESYKVIGALEFLGNPVGMVNKLGTGVTDFFYLPAKGAVQSPAMFGIGLAKGSLSLVRGTLSGVFGTVGSITGSVAKGFAMASFDDRFIEKSAKKQQDAPKHAAAGFFEGGKSLGMGLFKGVTGLVTDPYKGARDEGASGFFKGVGKGLLGVVAKPTSGAVSFASQSLTGIGNTVDYLADDKLHPARMRPQRFIPLTGLTPYDRKQAEQHEATERMRSKQRGKAGKPTPSK